ncbi:MAG: hypothetical protein OCC46_05675 [Pseudodesulfovibrio sp.]
MLCAIPMEIVNRELDGVLYLAMHLAKQGIPTLFGERMVHEYIFRLNKGKPVIYFDQEQNGDVNQFVLDEGGLVINLNAEGQNLDMYPQIVDIFAKVAPTFSAMFVRGEEQKKSLVEKFPEDRKDCVIASGHPSFDILNSRFNSYHEDPDIVAQHGRDYIQINTQFVTFNHKMGFDDYLKMISKLKEWKELYSDESFLELNNRQREFEGKIAHEFIEMAKRVAAEFPDRHIIVRPHPMEGHDFYTSQLSEIPNLFVRPGGAVRPWLSSAATMIHHSCTTGVEALLMGKNVVRFDPIENELGENMQSHAGMRAQDIDQVIELVRSGTMSESERQEQIERMRPHMANCGEDLASPAIAGHVAKLVKSGDFWLPEKLNWLESAKCWRKYFSKLLRVHQPGRVGKKVRYALEKFPRLPFSEVETLVGKLKFAEPDLPDVELQELGLNVFLMKPKS